MSSRSLLLLLASLLFMASAQNQETSKPESTPLATAADRRGDGPSASGPHFARARELYAIGPTKAAAVVAELDLELRDHPENVQAMLLKAMTQMGVGQFDPALATLDRLSAVASKTGTIHPNAVLLRARIEFYKGECATAKRTLEPYSAFFQGDAVSKAQYDSLMAAIADKLKQP
jgi:hypothetical protein